MAKMTKAQQKRKLLSILSKASDLSPANPKGMGFGPYPISSTDYMKIEQIIKRAHSKIK